MIASSTSLTIVPTADVLVDAQPLVNFNMISHIDFPSFNRKATVIPRLWACTAAFTTARHTASRVPQLIAFITASILASIILAPTTVILISTVVAPNSTVQTTPISAISFIYVPPNSKGKAILVDDDVDLPLFTFEIGYSSHLALSHS